MEKRSGYNIPIARPCFTGQEAALIQQALESGWVSQGPAVKQFEEAVVRLTGAGHAVAVTSCTTALHLSMLVNGIGAGDDVICPSYSFIATANGIRHAGAEPSFADIDPATLNLDPAAVDELIASEYTSDLHHRRTGNKLKAILIVHQVGIPADIEAFDTIAKRYGITLLEDAACGIGSSYKGQPIGGSGNMACLSFHPRKLITTGEGGMILTGCEALAEKARVLRAHGASVSDLVRHRAGSTLYESYEVVGYNYRMTDIQAVIGLKQLELLDWILDRRRQIAERYNEAFSAVEELELITPPPYVSRWNYQSYPLRLRSGGEARRDDLMRALEAQGIASRRGIPPIHREPVYDKGLTLPHTEGVSRRSFFLPIFPQLTDDEVEHVISSVKRALTAMAAAR